VFIAVVAGREGFVEEPEGSEIRYDTVA